MTTRDRRARLDAFYALRRQVGSVPSGTIGQLAHDALCGSLRWAEDGATRRRPSICLDETPVVYSLQLKGGNLDPAFRMLVEPAGLGVRVSEQVAVACAHLRKLVTELGWKQVLEHVDFITERILPTDRESTDRLWGGVWLGMSDGPQGLDLRIYVNLRHGDATERWQRVADVLCWYGDPRLSAPLTDLIDRIHRHGIPLGIAGVFAEDRLSCIRVYVGLHSPSYDVLCSLGAPNLDANKELLSLACSRFAELLGSIPRQGITVGFDFRLNEHTQIVPVVARTKVDLCCQLCGPRNRDAAWDLANSLAQATDLPVSSINAFRSDLVSTFGEAAVEYVGVGMATGSPGFTVYARPDNLASLESGQEKAFQESLMSATAGATA